MNFSQFEFIAIAVAAIIVGYFVYKILNFFGIIGTTKESEGTKELNINPAMTGNKSFLQIAGSEYKKKYGKPITTNEVKRLTPTSSTLLEWKNKLVNAKGFFNDNENSIYNVFRNFKTKFDVYMFSQFFQTYQKVSLIDYLDFMDETELSKLNDLIKSLPTI